MLIILLFIVVLKVTPSKLLFRIPQKGPVIDELGEYLEEKLSSDERNSELFREEAS